MDSQIQNSSTSTPRKGQAITSLILGILSIPTCGLLIVGGIAGIVLGISALRKARAEPTRYAGKGLAIAGIVTSALSLLLVIPGIIAAIAIPNLVKSQQAAQEFAAAAEVRAIGEAQRQYVVMTGGRGYADLNTLIEAGFISGNLASGEKAGYVFSSEPVHAKGMPPMFDTTASPISTGTFGTGNKSYYLNETFILYETEGSEPPRATPENRVPKTGTPVILGRTS